MTATPAPDQRETEALLPCPFCGEQPSVDPFDPEREGDAWTRVRCDNESCPVICHVTVHADHTHRAEAIAAWNTRASHRSPNGEGLREVLEQVRTEAGKRGADSIGGSGYLFDRLRRIEQITLAALTQSEARPPDELREAVARLLYDRLRNRMKSAHGRRLMEAWEDALPETRAIWLADADAILRLIPDAPAREKE